MRAQEYIAEVPNIQEYISPYIERVEDDCLDNLVDEIVAQYTHEQEDKEEDQVVLSPLITYDKALNALHTLRRYKEENRYGDLDFLRELRKHERTISS